MTANGARSLLLLLTASCAEPAGSHESPPPPTAATSGGRTLARANGFSGVGWSTAPTTDEAAREALRRAELGSKSASDLTFVYYTPQHDPSRIVATLRADTKRRRMIGMTSHDGLLTADGYHTSAAGVVGVLAVRSDGMSVGIGGATFGPEGEGEAGRSAYRIAVADAGRPATEKPTMVVMLPTLRSEEKVLAAITTEVGPDVPVIGGTAAGPSKDIDLKRLKEGLEWSIIVNDQIITSGVAVAVLYAPRPFGWAYGGGFTRSTSKAGVITDAEPRMIRKIDGRPALDVYDEWVGGELKAAMKRGENMLVWCALHPFVRQVNGIENGEVVVRSQFLHPHPNPDQKTDPGSILVGANVTVGERLHVGEGSWNILLNRFAQLPRLAKTQVKNLTPFAGLFFYCGGALETIPYEHRGNMGYLVSQSMGKELRQLVTGFSAMVESIKDRDSKIQSHLESLEAARAGLEMRVAMRTQELHASEQRTRAIIEYAADAIVTLDGTGVIDVFNPAAARMFGHAQDEATGMRFDTLLPRHYAIRYDQLSIEGLESGVATAIGTAGEITGLRRDGTEFPMHIALSEVSIDGNRLLTAIVRDISERGPRPRRRTCTHGSSPRLATPAWPRSRATCSTTSATC